MHFSSSPARHLIVILLLPLPLLLAACRSSASTTNGSETAVKISIAADGLYRLTRADLNRADLPATPLSADDWSLTSGGEPVPFTVVDESLVFYGQAPDDRYTNTRPYILRAGEPGVLMDETPREDASGLPTASISQTLRLEENEMYVSLARGEAGIEPWFWHTIQVGSVVPVTFDLPAAPAADAVLTVRLWGTSHAADVNPDHDLDIVVNGRELETVTWDGETEHFARRRIPATHLQAGENSIVFDNSRPGAAFVDIMQLDWLTLAFRAPPAVVDDRLIITGADGAVPLDGFEGQPLLVDVTDPAAPRRLTTSGDAIAVPAAPDQKLVAVGRDGYLEPATVVSLREGRWANTDLQADLIVVAPDAFLEALEPLVVAREAEGLSVAVVPVAEIYDGFGHGAASPVSIHNFVTYAYENWQAPAPRYLFLVGDATRDYRGYATAVPENSIPAYMVPVNYSGETVSDARLADVDGDLKPDLAVGRWPVAEAEEVRALVKRTLAYEAGEPSQHAVFAADGTSAEFSGLTNALLEESDLPEQYATILDGPTAAEVTSLWNDGAWLMTYTGHGSLDMWGKDSVFTLESVEGLASEATPPVVVQLTCLTGLFAHPTQQSLSEAMLLHEDGPVLIIAATSLTVSTYQKPFAVEFLRALQDPAVTRIGDALQQGKSILDVTNNIGSREISDTFGLLGDPSARIIRPTLEG